MATSVTRRPAEQYLGNSDSDHMEVHDLHNENTNCQVDEIIQAENAVVFSPDTLVQAASESYDPCSWCLSGSTR